MSTKKLLAWALEYKGHDGLLNGDHECSCSFEDLEDDGCEAFCLKNCVPAYLHADGEFYTDPEECDGGCRV